LAERSLRDCGGMNKRKGRVQGVVLEKSLEELAFSFCILHYHVEEGVYIIYI